MKEGFPSKLNDRYGSAVLLVTILALFITFNKAAYQSYFSDDDFSNLAVARFVPWLALPKALFSLSYVSNVRPFGILYYKILGSTAHYHFDAYVLVLQALHIATSLLLWVFLRRLGLRPFAAALGCLFFAMNASTLPAYWKPMYVFDVLCGFWVILSLFFYQRSKFVLSLLCAWLAFRSKEMELMLPFLLLTYECGFGQKRHGRWNPLIPFFLMSLSFGIQSLIIPAGPESAYSMHLTPTSLWAGLTYYGGKLLYAPFSGLTISIGLLFLRQRFINFGVIGFWIMVFPMLLFPGRQSGAYLYVPLLAFTAAIAGLAEWKPSWAAIFFLIWIPATYEELRVERNPIIAFGHEHRPYVTQILAALRAHPNPSAIVYEGTPIDFAVWGQEGLFPYALDKHGIPVMDAANPGALETLRDTAALLLTWDGAEHKLLTDTYPGEGHELSYVDFGQHNPIWQLKRGWKGLAGGCRWTAPDASITLREPADAVAFVLRLKPQPGQIVRVISAGGIIGEFRCTASGPQTVSWPVSPARDAVQDFEITANPPIHLSPDAEPLGVMICACGFLNR